ncbi:hypothetical protein UPYG_G00007860 [Umbra pygmaea]|uniref:Leiomodin-3 n=1 Tax=Umbra pygmaea TaxID=75934 RepID=A0ABD0XHW1_UMBPY
MSNKRDPDMEDINEEDIDEDNILASLSPEELQELQKEMDVLAPDERVPLGQRQKDQKKDKPSADSGDEDIDEDNILANLSPEELKELQTEMDVIVPDERVPVGQRQKSQTEKTPTGSFDHRGLVDYLYWEKESKRMLEEERLPVTLLPSKKTMEVYAEKRENEDAKTVYEVLEEVCEVGATDGVEGQEVGATDGVEGQEVGATDGVEGQEVGEDMIEIVEDKEDVTREKLEKKDTVVKEERFIEKQEPPVRVNIKESLVDNSTNTVNTNISLQAPLEFTDMKEETKSTEQNKTTSQIPEMTPEEKRACFVPEKEVRVINKLNIPKLAIGGGLGGVGVAKKTSRPSGNETNLETTLDKIRNNNPAITDVNLNNIENIPKEMLIEYVDALKKNKHVKTFSIANTGADENTAFMLAKMLRENRSIATLNIESNFITGKGIIAIIRCLQFNETLTELRFHNQRHMLGHHAEMEVARLLKANNTLLKMGYQFEQAGPRMVVTNLLTRNLDRQRQMRNEEQNRQQQKEQKDVLEMYERALNLPRGLLAMLGYVPPEIVALMPQLSQSPRGPVEHKPEPASTVQQSKKSPHSQHKQFNSTPQSNRIPERSPSPEPSDNPLRDIQLKRTPKKRDHFLGLESKCERNAEKLNIQLRKTTAKQRDAAVDEMVELKATLKDVMKTLKPVPRRRQPPKVDLTPRDELLNEIKKSNIAYLKAVPLPKELESRETSLFNL